MNGKTNRLITTLRSWFEPIVEKSSKQPLWVAAGLASVGAVLLIVLLRAVLPNSLGWLATAIVLTLLAAYIWMDWDKRRA
jgi:VIT1/CCC1 family predicted Fe2+/Mn2+ transporter